MTNCLLIFPNNLFKIKYLPKGVKQVFIIEDPLFFGDKERIEKYSKLKLVLHRASMKYYQDHLKENNFQVKYIEFNKVKKYTFLKKYQEIHHFELADHLLKERLEKSLKKSQELIVYDSPLFLLTLDDLDEYQKHKGKSKTFFHKHFYDWQLKKLDIPYISKSYDTENRNAVPKNMDMPQVPKNDNNSDYVKEAKRYVNKNFSKNYGDVENFVFPITHKTSKKWIKKFLKERLKNFGTYQDAILEKKSFMFHSLLAPMINIGLIAPRDLINYTIKYYEKHKKEVKINNFEGFIRQVIGWREYERMLYQLDYKNQVSSNYFGNTRKLNKKWYDGTTGIKPIDDTIKKAFTNGYLHHIERLMVMLNFMVLSKIHPLEIYKWFMEFSCDSYDWVMVGNVYGMGYFSTNTMRKPYLSTSNYILKMSDYKKDGHWNEIWDSLFYNFLLDNKTKLKGGAAFYLRNLNYIEKKSKEDKKAFLDKALYL